MPYALPPGWRSRGMGNIVNTIQPESSVGAAPPPLAGAEPIGGFVAAAKERVGAHSPSAPSGCGNGRWRNEGRN